MICCNGEERKTKLRASITIVIGVCWLLFTASVALASETGFKIKVPRKDPFPLMPIAKIKVIVTVASESQVTFKVTDPQNVASNFGPFVSGTPAGSHIFPLPPGAVASDLVTVVPLSLNALGVAPPAGDPARKKYVILLNLNSDFDPGSSCVTKMLADEEWRIEVLPGSPEITSVCAQSLDQNVPGNICSGTNIRTVPLSESIATVTKLNGMALDASALGCRPGVDAVLVLDRSGSMASAVLGGSAIPKIDALHTAVTSFINVWNILRTNEVANTPGGPALTTSPADNIGVVYFDSEAKWLSELNAPVVPGVSSTINGLKPYDPANADVVANVPLVGANSATSIGGGLLKAATAFTGRPPDNRKVILLMTDGWQNTDPMAQVAGSNVQTTGTGGTGNLPNQPPLQIYTLAVGTDAAVNPVILQQIAGASGGFYMNSQTDASVLPTFFLELLQNFVKFSTVETLRMASNKASASVPYVQTIPVTTTTQSITFHVDFDAHLGPLTLSVQPPGGAPAMVQTSATGALILNRTLPLPGTGNSGGDWTIRITSREGTVPFNLIVLGDDVGLNSDLISIAADYSTTDKIKVEARINELEKPILGIGSHPKETIVVKLVGPGTSLGDLLSSDNVGATPPASPDRISPVQAKLDNILKGNPNALGIKDLSEFTLVDNGTNGDAKAGDGVYTALIPPQIEGQYNLLFGVEGQTQGLGRFSRMQLKTINVRAIPSSTASLATAKLADSNVLQVTFTPMTSGGHHVGPGWANYIWFTSPRTKPVKPIDNLNGTYSASIPFSGPPPRVRIHFIRDAVLLTDDITADKLPVPLNDGNVVISKVDLSGITPFGGASGGSSAGFFSLGLRGGVAIPHGPFSSFYDPSGAFTADLEYHATDQFSVAGIFGYRRFRSAFGFSGLDLYQFSGGPKVYLTSGNTRPFVNGGVGAFKFGAGSTKPGIYAGGGFQFRVRPKIWLEAEYDYHSVFTSGSNFKFSTVQGGVRFRF